MLHELLPRHAQRLPERVALRVKRHGDYQCWSYAQLWQQARSAAAFLHRAGVARGERVALYSENCPEWALACMGIYLAGAVAVPLDAQYKERELRTVLAFARCRAVLCSESRFAAVEAVRSCTGVSEIIPLCDRSGLFQSPPLKEPVARRPEEPMAVIFTSGTTGDPKGVCLSVGNFASNVESILRLGFMGEDDTVLCLLPLHHCYPLTASLLAPLAAGGSITFCTSLRMPEIMAAICETGVTVVPGVPKFFEGLERGIFEKVRQGPRLKRWGFQALYSLCRTARRLTGYSPGRLVFRSVRRALGPRFRFFVSGGAALDREVAERFLDLGIKVLEGYGMTETSPVITINPINAPRPGTVGRPMPDVEVSIASPDAAGIGEILVRGPNVMAGYDRRPEETAHVLRDGWLHTGDMGFIDSKGYLHITGRIKDLIVFPTGKKVYPEDVERHYGQSPLVKEICVLPLGRADGRVERLCAVVVPNPDELDRQKAVSAYEELRREFSVLSQALPSYMRVSEIRLAANELPRTHLGKLRRAEIRQMVFPQT